VSTALAAAPDAGVPERARGANRYASIPSTLHFAHSHDELACALVRAADRIGVRRVALVVGRVGRELLGRSLLIDCRSAFETTSFVATAATVAEVERLRAAVREAGADVVVSCGGGQTLDVGKYSAALEGLPFFSVPTQATHDGVCSPVAVLRPSSTARAASYGAQPPAALLVPVHVIAQAPRRTFVSGIADTLANLVACEDWAWAARVRDEEFDDYAALLARTAAELITARAAAFARDDQPDAFDVETLLRALVLSGLAMTIAGSSRPCSGPEHLISHAFDELGLGNGTHGEQVGVGCAVAVRFYDHGLASVVDVLRRVGAPTTPQEIGIEREDALRAVSISHRVRPGRHTRLSAALAADPAFVREVAEEAWSA